MELKTNILYYGDNLPILRNRDYLPDNSIDLVYLDPPFNSKRDYNLLFKEKDEQFSPAQIKAFEDTWHWGPDTEAMYRDLLIKAPFKIAQLLGALVGEAENPGGVGRNDVTAYLTMMTARLIELYRVLKPTGSLYLHCDPIMSHYIKLVLDQIFSPTKFRREIVWRSGWVSGFKAAAKNWVRNHDIIFFFTKSDTFTFNKVYKPHAEGYKRRGGGGRKEGVALDDVWTDIYSPWIMSFSKEKLGYATQKPLALLERLIQASSNEGDVVLDPFCGCGTALVAAHKLNRRWLGIDITHLAIAVMKRRLQDHFPGIQVKVIGEPVDLPSARQLARENRYQFQWWAISLVNAQPLGEKKKGADKGIDGVIRFLDDAGQVAKRAIVQVKSGAVHVKDIRELKAIVANEAMGIFITLEPPTRDMLSEALSAGSYHSPLWNRDYPKIQIIATEELLQGEKLNIPEPKPPFFNAEKINRKVGKQLKLKGAGVELVGL